jgi:type VI protein secretion system component Hcp
MSWSNIYCQILTKTGPVVGEGLLDGFQGSIELIDFKWGMKVRTDAEKGSGSFGLSVSKLKSMAGLSSAKGLDLQELEITKRFDIASSRIHSCIDNDIPIASLSITVLHIKQGGRVLHQPGFTFVASDGYFTESALSLSPSGNAAELTETVKFNFRSVNITYLKRMGKDNFPMNPFFYAKPANQ